MIGDLVPLAVAVAASPFPIIPAILLLFTARPRATGLSFLAGWFGGVAVVTAAFVVLASVIERSEEPADRLSWVRVALGVVLIALGVRTWLMRGESTEPPGWMRSIDGMSPAGAARLALILSAANPKIVALAAAAGITVGAAEPGPAAAAAAVVGFSLVASVTVALPVVLYVLRGERILRPLGRARDWLQANNAAVMAVVLVVIGVLVIT